MKIGNIVEPNEKGQIVIPKKIRDKLDIKKNTPLNMIIRDDGIHLYPIREVTTPAEIEISRSQLLAALEKSKGMWVDDKDFDRRQKTRMKIEFTASKRRKTAW